MHVFLVGSLTLKAISFFTTSIAVCSRGSKRRKLCREWSFTCTMTFAIGIFYNQTDNYWSNVQLSHLELFLDLAYGVTALLYSVCVLLFTLMRLDMNDNLPKTNNKQIQVKVALPPVSLPKNQWIKVWMKCYKNCWQLPHLLHLHGSNQRLYEIPAEDGVDYNHCCTCVCYVVRGCLCLWFVRQWLQCST